MSAREPRRKASPVTMLLTVIAVLAMSLTVACHLVKAKVWQPNLMFASHGTQGVDLSEYQGETDFDALGDAGIEFVYVKATEGSSHRDSQFARNWAEATGHGMPVGAYHFFSFDSPGTTQAENFLSLVGTDMTGRLLPAVDIEWYGGREGDPPDEATLLRELHAFMDAVEGRCGVKPIIYAQSGIYGRYRLAEEFPDHLVWASSLSKPVFVDWRVPWTIWQYSNRGEIAGIGNLSGHVDLNVLAEGVSVADITVR